MLLATPWYNNCQQFAHYRRLTTVAIFAVRNTIRILAIAIWQMLSIQFGSVAHFSIGQAIQMDAICFGYVQVTVRRNVMENFIIMWIVSWQIEFNEIGRHINGTNGHRLRQRYQVQAKRARVASNLFGIAGFEPAPALPHRAHANDIQIVLVQQVSVYVRQQRNCCFGQKTSGVSEQLHG